MKQEAGKCPKCGSENIDWETCVNDGNQLYYPFRCEDCGVSGKEWYSLHYEETTFDEQNSKEAK